MAIIDNVLKKYDTKGSDKKSSLSVKIDANLYRDIDTVCNHLGISKSQLVADIIEASGISKKAEEIMALKEEKNTSRVSNAENFSHLKTIQEIDKQGE
ncbi:Uncharacterised protein [Campylobacter hyointestinalis subsp. hyointestinalis]|uniref:Uncharacterized protein n=1 Tax=Campylobacter hyointestinalis subsp. hyointestinalis TaxID=91352 RepID=A0A9W5AT87_CAMHY|nr:hypothetical protein [Campylobacter hyointestinalis]CUU79337.1 Uncharacterised protein [Campylobacter hyointestinalis subsp. hyointestinalis]CUU83183.1 Uncharacterised protein [Campylobacter hyointestinalis subsp. hyointestinalis]CUU88734.1 Uncharacterised protein [Campylobacter hyointestinalis subsp. hyointestinalis]